MIIVTSVLVLGAIGLGSFVPGQPNISSYQTTNQSNTMDAGGGGAGSCVDSNNSLYQTTNQSNTMGAGGGGAGSSVDSKDDCRALIIFR